MTFLRKNAFFLLALCALLGTFFLERKQITNYIKTAIEKPCEAPIPYSIGAFDKSFGISKERLLADLVKAEKVWEDARGADLFYYEPEAELKVNLIYDYRQQATDKLKSIGLDIKGDRASYDSLKSRYDSLTSYYTKEKSAIENDMSLLEDRRKKYEDRVSYWNKKGGAPEAEYRALEAEKNSINAEIARLNQRSNTLNDTADTINSLATVINQLITELNLNVKKYNSTTAATGEEFDEGEFILENGEMRIDVYQFDDENKLVRVLAHEFGHALGLEHVEDTKAIMYKLNQSSTLILTDADKVELDRVCGILAK